MSMQTLENNSLPGSAVRGISLAPAGCVQKRLLTGKRGLTFTGETESGKNRSGKVPVLTDATVLSFS